MKFWMLTLLLPPPAVLSVHRLSGGLLVKQHVRLTNNVLRVTPPMCPLLVASGAMMTVCLIRTCVVLVVGGEVGGKAVVTRGVLCGEEVMGVTWPIKDPNPAQGKMIWCPPTLKAFRQLNARGLTMDSRR